MKEFVLTQGKVTIVDDEDFDKLNNGNKWFCWKSRFTPSNTPLFYAVRHCNDKTRSLERMHNVIMVPPAGLEIDHIDGNGLNNQKINLRFATRRQNRQNLHIKKTSRYPGVFTEKRLFGYKKPWRAAIQFGDVMKHLGYFSTEEEAAESYRREVETLGMSVFVRI